MSKAFAIPTKADDELPGETQLLMDWWYRLEEDKGARATLRRCKTLPEIMVQPAFARLCQRLQGRLQADPNWQPRLATVVGLLAHCKSAGRRSLPEAMAQNTGGTPVVSELRFRRLLQEKPEDLYRAMIRILAMLDHTANLSQLIHDVYHWNDATRKRWAFAYFPLVPERQSA